MSFIDYRSPAFILTEIKYSEYIKRNPPCGEFPWVVFILLPISSMAAFDGRGMNQGLQLLLGAEREEGLSALFLQA